ncbi:MAG: hypothetical protein ABEJ40_02915 [Haloarculaceae archaeon]
MDRPAFAPTVTPRRAAGAVALLCLAALVGVAVDSGALATPSNAPGDGDATAAPNAAHVDENATAAPDRPGERVAPGGATPDPPAGWHVAGLAVGANGTAVTVTYANGTGPRRQFAVDGVDPGLTNASAGWAYLPRSALPAALRGADGPAAGVVTVGEWALVGDLAGETVRIGPTRLTVAAPAGMAVDPGRKAGFLARFLGPYSLGPPPGERVTLVVAPDALPSDGRTYGTAGYVTQHAFWDGDVASVWVHEYVHARQAFELTPGMTWFGEASATYLSYRVMAEQYDPVTDADVRARLAATPDFPDAALANRSTWAGTRANYHRGAKLLYAVDAAIRRGSDGNRTVVDVFRAMNRRDDPVSVAEFVRLVERFAGGDVTWLRSAITESGDLDPRVERARGAFEG